MKYYGEITKKLYDDEKSCLAAEEKEREIKTKAKQEEEKLKETKRARAQGIETLIGQRDGLDKQINEAINSFIKDYGAFHYSYRDDLAPSRTLFDLFSDFWF